ncbi:unnamed protein product [marine sediment metagenome]|uniref:Lcl C-terminal domain-containing protein n=1 Tax=marine sediment metagenome TaxID=412755 RepID=X1QUV4_9ZZZZ
MQDKVHTIKPLSRGLPKTGQTYSIKAGDDGALEIGWWLGRLVANNKKRFIEKELVSLESVLIDRATSLIWPKNLAGAATDFYSFKTWDNAMTWVATLNYGGFNDWRMPNIFELCTLYNGYTTEPCFHDTIFSNVNPAIPYWTSSMKPFDSSILHAVLFQVYLEIVPTSRLAERAIIPCRSI